MTERAEADSRQTGQTVSPGKYAKIRLEKERAEHLKSNRNTSGWLDEDCFGASES